MKKLLLILGALPAIAMAKVPDSGFYVDLGAGMANTNYFNTSGNTGTLRIDGGYNFTDIIGIQLGANNYFDTSMTSSQLGNYSVNGYGFDFSVIPNIPIGTNNQVNIFFRLGAGYDSMSAPVGNTNSFVDVEGMGVRYDISAHLGVSAQWIARGLLASPQPANYSQNDFLANVGFYF